MARKLTGSYQKQANDAVALLEKAVGDAARQAGKLQEKKNTAGKGGERYKIKEGPLEDDEYSTEGIRWVYDLDVVYKKDLARFWEAVANLDRRGYYYPRSKNGLYIIESGNKMFFTDGDYRNPSVESVIWFDDAFETNLAELKEWIYNEERTFGRHDESLGLIEDVCGYGYVREFRKEVYRSNERETERRKGANRKGHTGGSEGGERYSLKGSDDYNLRKLQAENEMLRERVDYWKGQTKRTERVTTDKKAVAKAARDLVRQYGADIDAADIQGDLQSLYDYMASGKDGENDRAASLEQEKVNAKQAEVAGRNAALYATEDGNEAGLVYDDYVRDAMDQDTADSLTTVAKQLGLRVRMVDSVADGMANADIQGSVVQIEKNNPNPIRSLFGHEMTHRVQQLAPESYRAFRDYVMQSEKAQADVQKKIADYKRAGFELSSEAAMDEIAADYAGEMIEDQNLLKRFIEKNRSNQSLLHRFLTAVKDMARKLTGSYQKQANDAVALLEKAVGDAAKQAGKLSQKSIESQTRQEYTGLAKYSINGGKYWRPDLTKKEWTLLERRLGVEIGHKDKYLDKDTKWLYADEKGVRVFALYGIGDGTDATPLYASGGEIAKSDYRVFREYKEELEHGVIRSREELSSWLKTARHKQGKSAGRVPPAEAGRTALGHDRISSDRRGSDGQESDARSAQTGGEVKRRFSLKNKVNSVENTAMYATEDGNEAGLVYDDYVRDAMDQDTAESLTTVAKQLGLRVRMVDSVAGGNAYAEIQGSDVLIEKNSDNPVRALFGHELTHRVQQLAPESYRAFRDYVMQSEQAQADVQKKIAEYRQAEVELSSMENNRFERLRRFKGELPNEWYAFTAGYFYIYSNESYMDYTILAKVRITESNMADIDRFVEALENGTYRSTETFSRWTSDFRRGKGRNNWHRIRASEAGATGRNDGVDVRARGRDHIGDSAEDSGTGKRLSLKGSDDYNLRKLQTNKNTAGKGGARYKIKEDPSGLLYVQADRRVLSGDNPKVWGKQIESYINTQIRHGEDVLFPTEDGHVIALTGRSAYKLSDRHKSKIGKAARELLSDTDFTLKGKIAGHIDELIRVGTFKGYKEDVGGLHENDIGEDGFNYYEAFFLNGGKNGAYYRVTFSATLNDGSETAYSIGDIQKRRFPSRHGSSGKSGALSGTKKSSLNTNNTEGHKSQEKTSMQIAFEKAAAQQEGNVNGKFSLKGSDDYNLRKLQSEDEMLLD